MWIGISPFRQACATAPLAYLLNSAISAKVNCSLNKNYTTFLTQCSTSPYSALLAESKPAGASQHQELRNNFPMLQNCQNIGQATLYKCTAQVKPLQCQACSLSPKDAFHQDTLLHLDPHKKGTIPAARKEGKHSHNMNSSGLKKSSDHPHISPQLRSHTQTQSSRWGLMGAKQRGTSSPSPCCHSSSDADQDALGFLSCKSTL